MKLPITAFKVAGPRFYPYESAALQIGDQLKLKAEPDNSYDPNAIAVLKADIKIGHVPKTQTHEYHPHLDNPELEVIIIALDLQAKYPVIIAQGIYEPSRECKEDSATPPQ